MRWKADRRILQAPRADDGQQPTDGLATPISPTTSLTGFVLVVNNAQVLHHEARVGYDVHLDDHIGDQRRHNRDHGQIWKRRHIPGIVPASDGNICMHGRVCAVSDISIMVPNVVRPSVFE